jgi:putative transposase
VCAKLRPDRALSDVIRDLKAGSSGWMHQVFPTLRNFKWQNGYAAFTVSASMVEKVTKYVVDQEKHHKKYSFRDEFIALLRAHNVEFDEKYLWQ